MILLNARQPSAPLCWCSAPATYAVPVAQSIDGPLSEQTAVMSDGTPGLLVCDEHVDRDGYEALA